MTNGVHPEEEKAVDDHVVTRSVQEFPEARVGSIPGFAQNSLLWAVSQAADEITQWGRNPKLRDRQLREFITSEPIFASALGVVCSRNTAFSWGLEGPDRQVRRYQRILEEANFGKGWEDLIMKVSIDLYTQDNGAFIEIIRENEQENGQVIGLNHLDSQRCFHTGAPEAPVIYMDRKGRYHLMKWWQVIALAEMPTAIEGYYGLQYCALTRLLRAAEIVKNISIYDYERTGGRHTRAIHMVKGITAGQIQDAIDEMTSRLNARGAQRYAQPLIVGSIDPKADIGHDTLELASLPDNFDREGAFKWYISQIAMAFLEDYQSFAPLPGGNLGSSQQSEVLHAKARGKGPALFQKLITHAFNFQVFPGSLEFHFDEQDLAQEKEQALVKNLRATERANRIKSFEITPGAARVLALDAGDLPRELFDALGGDDVTQDVHVNDESAPDSQLGSSNAPKPQPLRDTQVVPLPTSQATPGSNPNASAGKEIDEMLDGLRERVQDVLEELNEERAARPLVRRVVERDAKGQVTGSREVVIEEEGTKPYSGGSDPKLPPNVKKMPAKKRRQWVHIFNSELSSHGDESRAFAAANGATK